jgi:hypothetical protein
VTAGTGTGTGTPLQFPSHGLSLDGERGQHQGHSVFGFVFGFVIDSRWYNNHLAQQMPRAHRCQLASFPWCYSTLLHDDASLAIVFVIAPKGRKLQDACGMHRVCFVLSFNFL